MTDRSDLNSESQDDQPAKDSPNENVSADETAKDRPTSSDASENVSGATPGDAESPTEDDVYDVDSTTPTSDVEDEGENISETLSTMKWDAEDLDIQQTLDEFVAKDESSVSEQSASAADDGSESDSEKIAALRDAALRSGVPQEIVSTLDELSQDSRDSISMIPHSAVVALSETSGSAIRAMVSQPQSAMKALAKLPTKALRALAELTPESLKAITTLPPEIIKAVCSVHDDSGATLTDIPPDAFATLADIPQGEFATISEVPADVISRIGDTDPEVFQTLAELPQELITTFAELPQNVIEMLAGMSSDALRTVADFVSEDLEDPAKTLAELPEAQRKTLEEIPADGLQTLAEIPQDLLETLAEFPPGLLATFGQMPYELRTSLSQLPPDFFKTLGELSAESLRHLSQVRRSTIGTLADLPTDAMQTLASLPQDAIRTINEIPEDAVQSLNRLSQKDIASVMAIPVDALEMFATLPPDAFQSLASVKSDDLKALAEIAPKTISSLAALDALQYDALGGLISESFGSMGLDSQKDPSVGSSLRPPGHSDAHKPDDDVDWDDDSIERTIESDEFTDSSLAEFESSADWSDDGTGTDTSDSADITDSSVSETLISGSWSDEGRDDDEAATVESVDLQDDGFTKTIQGDSPEADDDGHARTVDSDEEDGDDVWETQDEGDLPPDVVRTMQTMWQDAKGQKQTGKTIKGEELLRKKEFDTGQVIKQKSVVMPGELEGVLAKVAAEEAEYVIKKKLGEGGMGFVWIAEQQSIGREVAFKTLKGKAVRQKEQRGKFLAEALVTGDLAHPNIVPIYDVGKYKDDELFYAMKKVEGTEWLDVIKDKSLNENLSILLDVADGIAFAHTRGVIHRDLKPENVMLGGFNEVLVMDWGLAFPTKEFKKYDSMGGSVSMGGTPAYMSPEMATGPIDKIKAYSDVYLMGAILFEIITGKPPHTGKNAMKCLMNAARNIFRKYDKEKFDGELMDIAMKAMATDPDQRYETALEFQNAIKEYLSHSESVDMSNRADEALSEGHETKDYNDFTRAIFGFENALDLWDGNERARKGITESRVAYADAALEKNDFDLGLGQLTVARVDDGYIAHKMEAKKTATEPAQTKRKGKKAVKADSKETEPDNIYTRIDAIYVNLETDKEERDGRERRLARMKRIGAISAVVVFIVVLGLSIWAVTNANEASRAAIAANAQAGFAKYQEYVANQETKKGEAEVRKAIDAVDQATIQQDFAGRQQQKATDEGRRALFQAQRAQKQSEQADIARQNAQENAGRATQAAARASAEAQRARESADRAARQERLAKYAGYISGIGLAAAKIEENSFDSALTILESYIPTKLEDGTYEEDFRDWEWGRLMHLCKQFKVSTNMGFKVNAIALDAKGERCFIGGENGLAQIRDLTVIEKPTNEMAVNLTGKLLVDLNDEQLGAARIGTANVYAVAFSPDGKYVATGTDQPSDYLKLWDAKTGKFVRSFKKPQEGHTSHVLSLDFSEDSRFLLSGSRDETVRLWDVEAGSLKTSQHKHTGPIYDVAFLAEQSNVKRQFLTAGGDGLVYLWTDGSPKENPWATVPTAGNPFTGHDGPVFAARFLASSGGLRVVSGGYDRRILIWDPQKVPLRDFSILSRQGISQPVDTEPQYRALTGHIASVQSIRVSADGKRILSSADDNTVKLWNVESGKAETTFRGHSGYVKACDFNPNGRWIISGSHDKFVRQWAIADYEEVRELRGRELDGHDLTPLLSATFSKDGQQILTASEDRTAKRWIYDKPSGEERAKLREDHTFREGHELGASSTAFFEDGTMMLTAAVDNSTRLWNMDTGTEIRKLENTGRNAVVALSSDGKWILTGSDQVLESTAGTQVVDENDVEPWNAKLWWAAAVRDLTRDPEPLLLAGQHYSEVSAVAVSSDSKLAITGDTSGACFLWKLPDSFDSEDGPKILHKLRTTGLLVKAHDARITEVAFFKDGTRVLTASNDNVVSQWDVVTGQEIRQLILKHPDGVVSMATSPNSKNGESFVVTSCLDGQIRVWNANTAKIIRTLDYTLGGVKTFRGRIRQVLRSLRVADAEIRTHVSKLGRNILSTDELAKWARDTGVEGFGERVSKLAEQLDMSASDYLLLPIINSVGISPDGKTIIGANSDDEVVHLWNVENGKPIKRFSNQDERIGRVWTAQFVPGSGRKILIVGGEDSRLFDWQDIQLGERNSPKMRFSPHGAVATARFSHDDQQKWVVTASVDNSARIWNNLTREAVCKLEEHTSAVNSAVFSRDGKYVLTASNDDTAILWTWNEETLIAASHRTFRHLNKGNDNKPADVLAAVFSHDDKWILTSSRDATARIWNTETGEEVLKIEHRFAGLETPVLTSAFSEDGTFVVTGSEDNNARLWRIDLEKRTYELHLTMVGHTASVTTVAFAPPQDRNGNGKLDDDEDRDNDGRLDLYNEDINGNGKLDRTEDLDGDNNFDNVNEDKNGNGKLDPAEDLDGDGRLDVNEDKNGNGKLDTEDLDGDGKLDKVNEDKNGNGKLDIINEDLDLDGHLDVKEDLNGNGILDVAEVDFDKDGHPDVDEDKNKNGVLDPGEDIDGDGRLDRLEDRNGNGKFDNYEEEDVDGDGRADPEDEDKNGNGKLDVNEDLDGDGNLDVNEDKNGNGELDTEDIDSDGKLDKVNEDKGNGVLDEGEDLNGNGRLDPGEDKGNGELDDAEDLDGDGYLDTGEDKNHNGKLDTSEDINQNGKLDPGEDTNNNGKLDLGEDQDGDGKLDLAEDLNGNGMFDTGEDVDHDGRLDVDEDVNNNRILDPGEDKDGDGKLDFDEDKNGNGQLDVNEDIDGDGKLDVNEDIDKNKRLDLAETRSRRILTGSSDNIVKLWDTRKDDESGQAKEILSLVGHTREITSVTFSDDGKQILSASRDGKAIIWLAQDWTGTLPVVAKGKRKAPASDVAITAATSP